MRTVAEVIGNQPLEQGGKWKKVVIEIQVEEGATMLSAGKATDAALQTLLSDGVRVRKGSVNYSYEDAP
jgi:hypothetical protein